MKVKVKNLGPLTQTPKNDRTTRAAIALAFLMSFRLAWLF
jgi:hypothetical protein